MRPKRITYTPAAVDADGFVAAATGATSPLTQVATSSGDSLAHQVNITSAANLSGITFTLTGTDENGVALTEAVTGPNATTVESSGYFLTLTSVAISATLGANTVDLGWVDEFVTPTFPMDYHAEDVSIRVDVTGTIDYTVQKTFDKMLTAATVPLVWSDFTDASGAVDMSDITTFVEFGLDYIPTGIRLQANSYSSGAALDLYVVHQ